MICFSSRGTMMAVATETTTAVLIATNSSFSHQGGGRSRPLTHPSHPGWGSPSSQITHVPPTR